MAKTQLSMAFLQKISTSRGSLFTATTVASLTGVILLLFTGLDGVKIFTAMAIAFLLGGALSRALKNYAVEVLREGTDA